MKNSIIAVFGLFAVTFYGCRSSSAPGNGQGKEETAVYKTNAITGSLPGLDNSHDERLSQNNVFILHFVDLKFSSVEWENNMYVVEKVISTNNYKDGGYEEQCFVRRNLDKQRFHFILRLRRMDLITSVSFYKDGEWFDQYNKYYMINFYCK